MTHLTGFEKASLIGLALLSWRTIGILWEIIPNVGPIWVTAIIDLAVFFAVPLVLAKAFYPVIAIINYFIYNQDK